MSTTALKRYALGMADGSIHVNNNNTLQVDQKADQLRMVQGALEEKRTELLKTETQLREMEEKYYSSSVTVQDQVVQDLRVSSIVN